MFSDNATINELTALLIAHGVRHAVTCPGSRNAPICHNLNEAGVHCHAVTDERSATFFGLGLSQATGEAVAVCVTSGSAILDTAAGVAEAFYHAIPLIIIAADRPRAWIGQLDGQTMPQASALGAMVRKAVTLPEGDDAVDRWHVNRLINEALMAATATARGPVLINVPLREPLYEFHTHELPNARICRMMHSAGMDTAARVAQEMGNARRPLIVIGQTTGAEAIAQMRPKWPTLYEPLAADGGEGLNEALHILRNSGRVRAEEYQPDKILYIGGHIVSKNLKQFLRSATDAETILISDDGELHDVFQNTTLVGTCDTSALIGRMAEAETKGDPDFVSRWNALLSTTKELCAHRTEAFSQLQVVQTLMEKSGDAVLHFANSSAVRLGCLASRRHFYCNRGINGIDGSVSTAAGHAAGRQDEIHLCVTGDLSFFYDGNALWNGENGGNLRILVMNNGGGGIFCRFGGLRGSDARERIVMAEHSASALGLCIQNGVEYAEARNIGDVENRLQWLTRHDDAACRPRLLEVFTNSESDQNALNEYYDYLVNEYDKRVEKN